jgi:hypothetical protein
MRKAEEARAKGNEGMARVCARRAAGIVTVEYLLRCGLNPPGASAYERLVFLQTLPGLSIQARERISNLLARVTPEHTLPNEADLIADARWLRDDLLDR